jgi:protein-disulfide isomerase
MQKLDNHPPVTADTLSWGHGPHTFEVFLEPTCPYSVKAFLKFDALLAEEGGDRITLIIRLQSQPWHLFSGVIIRCILAAATLEGGRENAKAVMAAVAAHRQEFEFDQHAGGPNLDASPRDIIERLERYSGISLADAFAIPTLDQAIKWQCKYARQNGVHVSPTFMIDGLIRPNMNSGDTVSSWLEQLD